MAAAANSGPARHKLACSNIAHALAASSAIEKASLTAKTGANIGIVSAYNDMLSAHQPFERYPELIRQAAMECGATAQFAGGVPAMCDGVTQGEDGMDLSLFSRDVIAMSTAIARTVHRGSSSDQLRRKIETGPAGNRRSRSRAAR